MVFLTQFGSISFGMPFWSIFWIILILQFRFYQSVFVLLILILIWITRIWFFVTDLFHQTRKVYSLTLSCTPGNMHHDSRASFLAHNLATPCLGHEPKVRIMTIWECGGSFPHILPLSHIPKNMKCDSQASLLACTFASLVLVVSPRLRLWHPPFSMISIIMLCLFFPNYSPFGRYKGMKILKGSNKWGVLILFL